jgi:hypothetical protein
MDMLQLLNSKMSGVPAQTYGSTSPCTHAEREKVLPHDRSNNEGAGHARDLVNRSVWYGLLKLATAAITIVWLAVWWLTGQRLPSTQDLDTTSIIPAVLPRLGARAPESSLLEVVQIYAPILTVAQDGALDITDGSSEGSPEITSSNQSFCEEILVEHSFGFSYGQPFVGTYTPPDCKFNRITWNLTVVSAGRQFDRLGIVYFGDIEVFRTSTAEPTANGIRWTYLKVCLVR